MSHETWTFPISPDEEQEPQAATQVESISTLLEQYKKPVSDGWLVEFHELPEGIAAYNASRMFKVGEDKVPHMLVRIEGKGGDQEFTSKLAIYQCSEDGRHCWPPPNRITNLPELVEGKIAQDPAISYVKENWLLTWVEVTPDDKQDPANGYTYKSVTYKGRSLDTLEHLVDSPQETKGLRYVELLDGRIGVSTRPVLEGERKVCFKIADTWEDVTKEFLKSAKEVEGLSIDGVWPGINDMELLANGDISAPGHIGRYIYDDIPNNREYVSTHCVITPEPLNDPNNSARAKYLKIIARAVDLNINVDEAPPKRPDLENVLYTSWLQIAQERGGNATWVGGFRDEYMAGVVVLDPLEEWRADHPEFASSPFPRSDYQEAIAV